MKRWIGRLLIAVAAVALLVGAGSWYRGRNGGDGAAFRTAPVTRGEVVSTITASGVVQAEDAIDVGAQIAGRIIEFGKDKQGKPIDFRSEVTAGQVLAKIDPVLYASDVASAEAQLKQAEAGVQRATADLEQFRAKFNQAKRDWERAQRLGPSDALAQVEYDTYQSNFESAQANLAVGEASIAQARSQVDAARASLGRAMQNLSYTTVTSPVDGVVIARRVNIGQTVVASLNAPSLFLLAKDLRRMEVWVAVNEADIGQIYPGQPVTFTVDTYPGVTFQGKVNLVRLDAQMTQNVVTYTVEVSTDNSAEKLLPYMTGNIQFEVSREEDALMVPNAALRWTPRPEQIAPSARAAAEKATSNASPEQGGGRRRERGERGQRGQRGQRGATTQSAEARDDQQRERPGRVWVLDGEHVRPIDVVAGITDGRNTAVRGEGLDEDVQVVVGEEIADAGAQPANANPFVPQMPSRRRGGGGGGGGGGGPPR